MGEDEASDVELLKGWRGGDDEAARTLLDRYRDAIARFFESHQVAEVDEMVQRTFTACVENRDRIREDGTFRGYLFGIARNQLLRKWTKSARHGTVVTPSQIELQDGRTSPSRAVARAQDVHKLKRALEQLPEIYREPLDMFFVAERPLAQISEAMGLPIGTVKSRLSRAKEMLRRVISEMDITPEDVTTINQALDDRPLDDE